MFSTDAQVRHSGSKKAYLFSSYDVIYSYVDQIDEGTAIFKISKDPPAEASSFVKFEVDIPSDYYLFLTGYAGKMLRKQIPFQTTIPKS